MLLVLSLVFLHAVSSAGTIATSGITAADIITDVRADLNESTASFWTEADLLQWIDEAVREIVNRTRCLETTAYTIDLVNGTYKYDTTGSFLSIETIIHNSGVTGSITRIFTLKRMDIQNLGHSKETGRPKFFAVWNDDIYIWPIPGTDEATTELTVFQVTLPTGVSATNSAIETPAYLDSAIVNYVKAKAYFKDLKETMGAFYMSLFEKQMAVAVLNVMRRNLPQGK